MNNWERIKNGLVFSFKGGIYPNEHKNTQVYHTKSIPIPEKLTIPLKMHSGAPGDVIVKVGEHVLAYQPLTQSTSRMSVPIHAPYSGIIEEIGPMPIAHPSGLKETCIVIKTDPKNEQEMYYNISYSTYEREEPETLLTHIKNMGIAGLGGAGFPTEVKLRSSTGGDNPCQVLIINGAECEPYITCDDRLMCERSDEIISGIKILQHILKPKFTVIAIEENKQNAINLISEAITAQKCLNTRVTSIPVKYPSGAARNLIKLITGVEVPYDARSSAYGAVVHNVSTVHAVYRAVVLGKPLVKRIVTITGEAIEHIGNYLIPFGTSIYDILKICNYRVPKNPRIIVGGPMMGFTLPNAHVPITKTTNCIIAPSDEELKRIKPQVDCIRCGRCAKVCPSRLIPYELYTSCLANNDKQCLKNGIKSCIECGCCSYVCPSAIRLVEAFRTQKTIMKAQKKKEEKLKIAKERYQAKLVKIKLEEELRAKRKAEALAKAKAMQEKKKAMAKAQETSTQVNSASEGTNANSEANKPKESSTVKQNLENQTKEMKVQDKDLNKVENKPTNETTKPQENIQGDNQ